MTCVVWCPSLSLITFYSNLCLSSRFTSQRLLKHERKRTMQFIEHFCFRAAMVSISDHLMTTKVKIRIDICDRFSLWESLIDQYFQAHTYKQHTYQIATKQPQTREENHIQVLHTEVKAFLNPLSEFNHPLLISVAPCTFSLWNITSLFVVIHPWRAYSSHCFFFFFHKAKKLWTLTCLSASHMSAGYPSFISNPAPC